MKYSTNESNFLVMTWSMTDTQMMSSNTQTLQESCVFFFLFIFIFNLSELSHQRNMEMEKWFKTRGINK